MSVIRQKRQIFYGFKSTWHGTNISSLKSNYSTRSIQNQKTRKGNYIEEMSEKMQQGITTLATLMRAVRHFTLICTRDGKLWRYKGEQARTFKIKTEKTIDTYEDTGALVLTIDEIIRQVERRQEYDKATNTYETDHEHFAGSEEAKQTMTDMVKEMANLSHANEREEGRPTRRRLRQEQEGTTKARNSGILQRTKESKRGEYTY